MAKRNLRAALHQHMKKHPVKPEQVRLWTDGLLGAGLCARMDTMPFGKTMVAFTFETGVKVDVRLLYGTHTAAHTYL